MPLTNLKMSTEDSRAYEPLLPSKEEENNLQGAGEYTFLCFYKNLFHQEVQAEIDQNFKNILRIHPD